METNTLPENLAPAPLTSNSLNTNVSQSQIFIHPEHQAGTLSVGTKPKTNFLKIEIFFSILILLSIITAALLVFVAIPRSQAVSFADSTNEALTTSNSKIDKLNTSLEALYKASTNQSTGSGVTLSDSNIDSSFVLGATTNISDTFSQEIKKLVVAVSENLDPNSKVKGFSIPADDPNKANREMRSLAEEINTKTASVIESNKKLSELVKTQVPQSAKTVQSELSELSDKTTNYADQAKKTANYYVVLTDSTIELTNLGSSVTNLKGVEIAVAELTTLKSKFADYKPESLPEGLSPYNKDVVDIFNTLLTLFKQIQSGSLNSYTNLLTAENDFLGKLEKLNTSSTNHLIDFWQNNKALSKESQLASEHDDLLFETKKLKDNNNFFLLSFLGEKQ